MCLKLRHDFGQYIVFWEKKIKPLIMNSQLHSAQNLRNRLDKIANKNYT